MGLQRMVSRTGEWPSKPEDFLPVVYDELRRLAADRLRHEKPGQTLQPTALVHEAWLRLVRCESQKWDSAAHFFRAAAEAMRRILVENARRKSSLKRGHNPVRVDLEHFELPSPMRDADILALDEALQELALADAVSAELIQLRFSRG
jgi:RNA polymerase sigma factor (TIGR02999 family)